MPISRPPHGEDLRRLGAMSEMLKVRAQNTPNMTVRISRGGFWKDENFWVETPDASTVAISAPITGARYDLVCLRDNGLPTVVQGTASSNPDLPAVPPRFLPLAAMYIQAGATSITNDVIYDVRPFFKAGLPPADHQMLLNRNNMNAHSISAITGLQAELDSRITMADVNLLIANKADINGTTSEIFVLNKDQAGVAGPDVSIMVERGAELNVGIRWNEAAELWEFTNDGTLWQSFNAPILSPNVVGYDNLTTALKAMLDGKALLAHTHDDRYYTETEMDAMLLGKSDSGHTHSAAEIVSGLLSHDRLPTNINPSKLADGTVSDLEFQRLNGVTAPIQTQLDGKAPVVHKHDASDIETGVLDVARIPTGIDAANLANGTVSNTEFQYLNNVSSNIQTQLDGKAASVHTHSATDIVSGVLHLDRIPAGITAAKIGSQIVSDTEFDTLNGVTSSIQTQLNGKASSVHTHTSGHISDFTTAAQAAAVAQTITNGVTTSAPSQNAVYDALVLKQDAEGASLTLAGQASDPASPAAGHFVLYVLSSDGLLRIKDSSGTVTVVGAQA